MFFRTKPEKARDKTLKRLKDARGDAAKRGKDARGKGAKRAKAASGAAADATHRAGDTLALTASSMLHSVSDAVTPRAEAAADTVRDRTANARERAAAGASHTRDRAIAGLDKGVDGAVPLAQKGVAGVGPKVDQARDTIVDDLLPRIQELLGSVQTSKDDLLSRQDGPVAVVTGSPKKPSRKGGFLIAFGLLAAIGAAVSYFQSQKSDSDDTDPWAGSSDRPIGGAPGVDTQVRDTITTQEPPLVQEQVGTQTAEAGASTDAMDVERTAEPTAQGTPTFERTSADTAAEGTPSVETAVAGAPSEQEPEIRMIDVDDVPGTDVDARDNDSDKPPA